MGLFLAMITASTKADYLRDGHCVRMIHAEMNAIYNVLVLECRRMEPALRD